MNRYCVWEVRKHLTKDYLIENDVMTSKKRQDSINQDISDLQTRITQLQQIKNVERQIINAKVRSMFDQTHLEISQLYTQRGAIIQELQRLREQTTKYHKKVRNFMDQIPNPSDIQGAYADRPARIEALQKELDEISRKMGVLQNRKTHYDSLQRTINSYGYNY